MWDMTVVNYDFLCMTVKELICFMVLWNDTWNWISYVACMGEGDTTVFFMNLVFWGAFSYVCVVTKSRGNVVPWFSSLLSKSSPRDTCPWTKFQGTHSCQLHWSKGKQMLMIVGVSEPDEAISQWFRKRLWPSDWFLLPPLL